MINNLVSNAIKHSRDGAEITVSFDSGKKNVTTSIRDEGEGIAPDHLPRIFERFYRVDKSRSREKNSDVIRAIQTASKRANPREL